MTTLHNRNQNKTKARKIFAKIKKIKNRNVRDMALDLWKPTKKETK